MQAGERREAGGGGNLPIIFRLTRKIFQAFVNNIIYLTLGIMVDKTEM